MTDIAVMNNLTAKFMKSLQADQRFRAVVHHLMEERMFQDLKHGSIEEEPHTPSGWLLLIEAELAEAKAAVIKGGMDRDSWRSEVLQVAALCVAALEQHGLVTGFDINVKREI